MLCQFRILALVAALLMVPSLNHAKAQDNDKQQAVAELLEATGMLAYIDESIVHMAKRMTDQLGADKPGIHPEALNIFKEEMIAGLREESPTMVANAAKLYEKYFTEEDIRALIGFYQTPVGRKYWDMMPKLLAESAQQSIQWRNAVVPRVMNRVRARLAAEGYRL